MRFFTDSTIAFAFLRIFLCKGIIHLMDAMDWKKDHKDLYFPPANPRLVDVPAMSFCMIDGHGDPNTSPAYQAAVEALFSLSYTLKFALKKAGVVEYAVYPLEGLWWADDPSVFARADKSQWDWTMMIAQPAAVTDEWLERARADAARKKDLPALSLIRLETFHEGLCVQMMHTGPFSAEGPNIARLQDFINQQGCAMSGKHHEIYLSDARRVAPEKMKTILRQPCQRAGV